MAGTIIIPILHMSKLRPRWIKCLAQGHTARKWPSQYSKACGIHSNHSANLLSLHICWDNYITLYVSDA